MRNSEAENAGIMSRSWAEFFDENDKSRVSLFWIICCGFYLNFKYKNSFLVLPLLRCIFSFISFAFTYDGTLFSTDGEIKDWTKTVTQYHRKSDNINQSNPQICTIISWFQFSNHNKMKAYQVKLATIIPSKSLTARRERMIEVGEGRKEE